MDTYETSEISSPSLQSIRKKKIDVYPYREFIIKPVHSMVFQSNPERNLSIQVHICPAVCLKNIP